ncbi:MAG: hypothetical protein CM1200mP10_33220 [Candidatus Neomarinimicrobiota bacterium]|nr:MAG: hypothetical protein CM1200mP10_33220 [Candidatus Neomarinimicrobiota bacterium]
MFRYFRYFRIQTDDVELTFDELDNNNLLFIVTVQSRRNNYEEIILRRLPALAE